MSNELESQIAEYQAAQACYLHYDSFRWQAGSLLIAGAFVFWGLLVSTNNIGEQARTIGLLSCLVALLMTIWVLFACHYRQISRYKLHRIHQLEAVLGMVQHRRFAAGGEYRVFGVRGHYLDLWMYILVSLGGPFVGWVVARFDRSYLLTGGVILVGVITFLVNERKVTNRLENLPAAPNGETAQHGAGADR